MLDFKKQYGVFQVTARLREPDHNPLQNELAKRR